jgi:hypothetical protein
MVICKKCNSTDIKSRSNYSHGKKSTAQITRICNKCGSTSIDMQSNPHGRRR